VNRRFGSPVAMVLMSVAVLTAVGCDSAPRLATPIPHAAPYGEPVRWAVAPMLNESPTSLVDPLQVADAIQAEVQAVDGINALPVNRTIAAMKELGIVRISSAHEAQQVMLLLDVDGLLVGSISTWNPYPPLSLGLALELHLRESAASRTVDPLAVTVAAADVRTSPGTLGPVGPAAAASGLYDAADHQVLKWVREYAEARHVPETAFGERIYLVSMDRYARFASWHLLGSIIGHERLRLAGF
jgi:hypothetical protein